MLKKIFECSAYIGVTTRYLEVWVGGRYGGGGGGGGGGAGRSLRDESSKTGYDAARLSVNLPKDNDMTFSNNFKSNASH